MLKKIKKRKKITVVTPEEHRQWHKKNGPCGNSKEHDACMKKWGITIKSKKR